MSNFQSQLIRISNLLIQTYSISETVTIKTAEVQLYRISQDANFVKIIHELMKNPQINKQLKFAASNYVGKAGLSYYLDLASKDVLTVNKFISYISKIIEDGTIYGSFKQPIIRASFILNMKSQNYCQSIISKLAGSISYYCLIKRTGLAMIMLQCLLQIKPYDESSIAVLGSFHRNKINMENKTECYKRFLTDFIDSVYYQMKKVMNGYGEVIQIDGYTHKQQFYKSWQVLSLLLCNFDFRKYHKCINLIFKNNNLSQILVSTLYQPILNISDQIKVWSYKVMTYIFKSFHQRKLFSTYSNFSNTLKQTAQKSFTQIVQYQKSINLNDSVTQLFITMINYSGYFFEGINYLNSQYIEQKFCIPIYQSFQNQLGIIFENGQFEQIQKFLNLIRYPIFEYQERQKKMQLLVEHPAFYNLSLILGHILKKIPDLQVMIYQKILSIINSQGQAHGLYPSNNIALLIILLLTENFSKYDTFLQQIQNYFFKCFQQALQYIQNNKYASDKYTITKQFIILMVYSVYADSIFIQRKPIFKNYLPQILLNATINTQYLPLSCACLKCMDVYFQQSLPMQQNIKDIFMILNKIHSIIDKIQHTNSLTLQLSNIYLKIYRIYLPYFSQSELESGLCNITRLIRIFKPITILQTFQQLLENDNRNVIIIIFTKIIPWALENSQEQYMDDLVQKLCHIIQKKYKYIERMPEIMNKLDQFLEKLIINRINCTNFLDNSSDHYTDLILRLYWRIPYTYLNQNMQIFNLLLFRCLQRLKQINTPLFLQQKFTPQLFKYVYQLFVLTNWIIINYSGCIQPQHINQILDMFQNMVNYISKIDEQSGQDQLQILIIGKHKLIVLLLMLYVPQLTYKIMENRQWRCTNILNLDSYEERVVGYLFLTTYHYNIDYDIPILIRAIRNKFQCSLLNQNITMEELDIFVQRYAHFYLKLAFQCIEKVYIRNSYSDYRKRSYQKNLLKNISADGYYNDVSDDSDNQEYQQGRQIINFFKCYKLIANIHSDINMTYKQDYKYYINEFLKTNEKLKKNRKNWYKITTDSFIKSETISSIRNMTDFKQWNSNNNKEYSGKKRIFLKIVEKQ